MSHVIRPDRYPTPPRVALRNNFATNLNPLGPPCWVASEAEHVLDSLLYYPSLWHGPEEHAFARWVDAESEQVVISGGGSAAIFALIELLDPARPVAVVEPTFWAYRQAASLAGRNVVAFRHDVDLGTPPSMAALCDLLERTRPAALFLCSPDNPSGAVRSAEEITDLARRFPDVLIVVDLTYAPFERRWRAAVAPARAGARNLAVVIGLSKLFCLPGLRIAGTVFGDPTLAQRARNRAGPLRLSTPACALLPRLLDDDDYLARTHKLVEVATADLTATVAARVPWIEALPSAAPFNLYRIDAAAGDAADLEVWLQARGLRVCGAHVYGLPQYVRIRAGHPADNARLVDALARYGAEVHARAFMVQAPGSTCVT